MSEETIAEILKEIPEEGAPPTGSEMVRMAKKLLKSIGIPEQLPEAQEKLTQCMVIYSEYESSVSCLMEGIDERDSHKIRWGSFFASESLDNLVKEGCINPEVRDFCKKFLDRVDEALEKGDYDKAWRWAQLSYGNTLLIEMNIAWKFGKPE